jgi:hypothetical protein
MCGDLESFGFPCEHIIAFDREIRHGRYPHLLIAGRNDLMEMISGREGVPCSEILIAPKAPNEDGEFSCINEVRAGAEETELPGPVAWESETDRSIGDVVDSDSSDDEDQASDSDPYAQDADLEQDEIPEEKEI